jgi:DNA-directed RNA polymerase subunit E'/Rpb7
MKTIEEVASTIYQPIGMSCNEFAIKLAKEYAKQLLEDYTNRIVNEIGLVKTTSEELNAKDYQPFITDADEQIWTINKEHILSQLPKFLKEKGI